MDSKLALGVVLFLLMAIVPDAWGATLTAFIDPWTDTGIFTLSYLKSYTIRHDGQGQLSQALDGQEWKIEKEFDSSDPGIAELTKRLNSRILAENSQVTLSDITGTYSVTLTDREKSSYVDYKITLKGDLNDYIIVNEDPTNPGIIDMGWKHFSFDGQVMIDDIDINTPASALELNAPEAYKMLVGTKGGELFLKPLINEESFSEPLGIWHYLFDPTGINVDANQFGLSKKIIDKVISKYTLGESSIREGSKADEIISVTFTIDREYHISTVNTIDIAELAVVGHTSISSLDDLETLGFSAEPIGNTTSTGGFPAHIVIGMSVMAAIGGGVFFFISSRQLKKDKNATQTGIDPARLQANATSASAGSYQTNRGVAQLRDDYDSGSSASPEISEPESTRGSMPKGWDKK